MRRLTSVLLLVLLAAACAAPSSPSSRIQDANDGALPLSEVPAPPPAPSDAALAALVRGQTELGLDLLRGLSDADEPNVVLSPWSISNGLALTHLGARGGAADEMAEVLRYAAAGPELQSALAAQRTTLGDGATEGLRLEAANRAYGQEGWRFTDAYLADLSRFHEAPLGTLDFAADPEAARREINAWAEERTGGLIPETFPPDTVTEQTQLALVNALYLDADWHLPFNADLTHEEFFVRPNGSQVEVPMMHFNEYPNAVDEA